MNRLATVAATVLAALTCWPTSWAAVTADEAAKLKSELTPFGAERAGNKDGSIPAWSGGYTTPIPGDKPNGRRGDPFKDDKPLFSITAKNVDQYADKLADGTKAMLKLYPDYRIDVYPSRRTAAAPQWVYDNTFKNATRGKMDGGMPEGIHGGIPFPIPKSGLEVMYNQALRWRGTAWSQPTANYQLRADGRPVMTTDGVVSGQSPYYFQDGSPESFAKNGVYWAIRLVNSGPPIRAGEQVVARYSIDSSKDQVWVYLTGQRRVRKLPNACCDTPTAATAGLMSIDEIEGWGGSFDRFDWKLSGKRELIVPYNGNKLLQPTSDMEILKGNKPYLNPDHVRWELHRVWVVDATLREGKQHSAPKGRYYIDEDTWQIVIADRWDAKGQLWKTIATYNFVAPDLPGTVMGAFGYTDLLSGIGYIGNLYNEKKQQHLFVPRYPDSNFTPDAMVGEGVR